MSVRCPIRGHNHDTLLVRDASHGQLRECPRGTYRWFVLAGRSIAQAEGTRMKRPRWGWTS